MEWGWGGGKRAQGAQALATLVLVQHVFPAVPSSKAIVTMGAQRLS